MTEHRHLELYVEGPEPKGSPTNPYLTGRQALALFLAVVLVLVVYVVGKENSR